MSRGHENIKIRIRILEALRHWLFKAAILNVKLKHLADWNKRRAEWAAVYNKLLADTGAVLPVTRVGNEHVWHLYVIRVKNRDTVRSKLEKHGIQTQIHYPKAVYQQPAYKHLGYDAGSFPETESLIPEILSLPINPFLREEEVQYVAETLKKCL